MPFPNEHAARQSDPGRFDRFRRGKPEGFPSGVEAIWGIRADGGTEIQSIRAKASEWTVAEFREWLEEHDFKATIEQATEKFLFGYSAGKARLAPDIVPLIPKHATYVEPFCGSSSVYLAKPELSETEVLNDIDPELIGTLRLIASLTDDEIEKLEGYDWVSAEKTHGKIKASSPSDKLGKVYKFLYLTRFSRRRDRSASYDPTHAGIDAKSMSRVRRHREQLKRAKIYCGDYRKVVSKFDGPNTFFFFDPPYVGTNGNVREKDFDEAAFEEVLRSIKGKFLVTYGVKGQLETKGFHVRRIMDDKSRNYAGGGGGGGVPTLLISNYTLGKALETMEEIELTSEQTKLIVTTGALAKVVGEELLALADRTEVLSAAMPTQLIRKTAKSIERCGERFLAFGMAPEPEHVRGLPPVVQAQVLSATLKLLTGMPELFMVEKRTVDERLAQFSAAVDALADLDHGDPPTTVGKLAVAEITEKALRDLDDKDLELAHEAIHNLFEGHFEKNDQLFRGGVRRDDVIAAELLLQAEMSTRKIPHRQNDGLAAEARKRSEAKKADLATSDVKVVPAQPKLRRLPAGLIGEVETDKREGVIQYHFLGKTMHVDFRVNAGGYLIGWTFEAQRPGSLSSEVDSLAKAVEVAETFSVEGDRFVRSLRGGVVAEPKTAQQVEWLGIDGGVFEPSEIGATATTKGVLATVARPMVEFGVQSDSLCEYFLSGEISGALVLTKSAGGWEARFHSAHLPHALRAGTTGEHLGLPESLRADVPEPLRFWTCQDEEIAKRMREALIKSRLFTQDNVRLVSGEFRRVQCKFFLAPASALEAETWRGRLATAFDSEIEESFGTIREPKKAALAYLDVGCGDLGPVVKTAHGMKGGYVISAKDTPSARFALSRLGETFKFLPGENDALECLDRIFVSSHPLAKSSSVEFVKDTTESKAWQSLSKRPTTAQLLIEAGPPIEWSGAVAAIIGEEGRKRVRALWEALSDDDKRKVEAAFARHMDGEDEPDSDLAQGILTRYGELAKRYVVDLDMVDFVTKRKMSVVKADPKAEKEERYVLGIVLEPEVRDAQGDIYSEEEVRTSAHTFMEQFQNLGLMHTKLVNDKAAILESYLAPVDFTAGGQKVKRGTWLLASRVKDDNLWSQVKSDELTGYSIGGSAVRVPDRG